MATDVATPNPVSDTNYPDSLRVYHCETGYDQVAHQQLSKTDDNVVMKTAISSVLDPTLVLEPSTITSEFDPLRFEAAASRQLDLSSPSLRISTYLVSSPYNITSQLLDLRRLTLSSLLFAKALSMLKPVRMDYATADYIDIFNWSDVLGTLRELAKQQDGFKWTETSFYIVIFRSKLKEKIDTDLLYRLDAMSHTEATESGGLLKYWFGKPDNERRNLATCECCSQNKCCAQRKYLKVKVNLYLIGFWHSREDARRGGTGPWHRRARGAARDLYESIVFQTHRLVVTDGATGFRLEDWTEAEG
jgi:hypothetical protein